MVKSTTFSGMIPAINEPLTGCYCGILLVVWQIIWDFVPKTHEILARTQPYAHQKFYNVCIFQCSQILRMPKSKRAKVVHLSKTQKKGKDLTIRLHANIQECIPNYPYIYVFTVHNMRNTYLKDVRTQLSDSRYTYQSAYAFHLLNIVFEQSKTRQC